MKHKFVKHSMFFCTNFKGWDGKEGGKEVQEWGDIGCSGKESASNAGDVGSIPGSEKPLGVGAWQPTSVFLPGKSHGLRSLEGCSP